MRKKKSIFCVPSLEPSPKEILKSEILPFERYKRRDLQTTFKRARHVNEVLIRRGMPKMTQVVQDGTCVSENDLFSFNRRKVRGK